MDRYTTLRELKRTFPPLEGEPSVRPQKYTTNPIKVEGVASRHRSPYTSPQVPAEEHRLTKSYNNLLHSKILPPQEDLQKTSRKEAKNEPVLVTDRSSTGRTFDQYWLLPLISTGHIGDHYWLIFSARIERGTRRASRAKSIHQPTQKRYEYREIQLCA